VTRARVYRASAVVIRQRNLGEADRIVTLFTEERGKLSAVAKGARRPRSKLAAALQLFSHSRVQLAAGRSLEIITQAQPVDLFYHLREDMQRYAHASYIAELTDALTEEGDGDPAIFALLLETLRGLDRAADPATVARAFELKLLSRLGYGPEVMTCVSCGTELEAGPAGFSPAQGGVVCARCLREAGAAPLAPEALAAMRELMGRPMEEIAARRLSRKAKEELERVMRAFVDYRLERPLRSAAFLSFPAAPRSG